MLKKISVHKRLVEHYSTWYSSHLMKLVVVGKGKTTNVTMLLLLTGFFFCFIQLYICVCREFRNVGKIDCTFIWKN